MRAFETLCGCGVFLLALSCASAPKESHPLGPEMAQLERDLASPAYRAMVKGMKNFNDLDGEIVRIDIPDNARRFAARHSAVGTIPELTAAYERRQKIESDFLALMRECYEGIGRAELYEEQVSRLFADDGAPAARALGLEPARIEPIPPAPDAASHWPRWRGPDGQGRTRETGLPLEWSATEGFAWKTAIPGEGNSSPVIWGDRIFLTTAFDRGARRSLVGVRRSDGALLWVKDAPSVEPEGRVIKKNGYASATPVVDGERVVAFFGNTGLVAFDLDGAVLWHRPFEEFDAMHGTGASPVIYGDLVILFQEQSSKDSVGIAVDKRTGDVVWRVSRPGALGWCTPLALRVDGRDELVYGASHTIVGYDPKTGEELWHCEGPTREVVPTLVAGNGLVYSCSGRNGPTLAIRPGGDGDVSTTHLAWKVRRGAPHVPSPVLSGDLLYLVNDTGILTCLDATSGESVYQKRLHGKFSASPLAAEGRIYLTNESGETFVVRDGRDFELLATNAIGESVLASMAVLDGTIYMRTKEHLVAIGGEVAGK